MPISCRIICSQKKVADTVNSRPSSWSTGCCILRERRKSRDNAILCVVTLFLCPVVNRHAAGSYLGRTEKRPHSNLYSSQLSCIFDLNIMHWKRRWRTRTRKLKECGRSPSRCLRVWELANLNDDNHLQLELITFWCIQLVHLNNNYWLDYVSLINLLDWSRLNCFLLPTLIAPDGRCVADALLVSTNDVWAWYVHFVCLSNQSPALKPCNFFNWSESTFVWFRTWFVIWKWGHFFA